MAEAHRGMVYQRKTPFEECLWRYRSSTTLPLEWSDQMAYVVGLTATDGCLITGRRAINFKSRDRALVVTYLGLLGKTNRVKEARTRADGTVFFTQFHDSRLYEWFRCIGLTPRKSFTLGGFVVPDRHLPHLLRGLLDGDGSILDVTYDGGGKARGGRYRTLRARFNSASRIHVDWVRDRILVKFGVAGGLTYTKPVYRLTYEMHASLELLPLLYPSLTVPCLERKREIWRRFVAEGGRVTR
jgi:intein/homing endonuclease